MKIIIDKKKEVYAKSLHIKIPMYYVDVYCFTPKMNKELENKHEWDVCESGLTMNRIKESRLLIVRFRDDSPSVVAHEMLHVVQMIMTFIGHNYDESGDEPSAYLLGYLVEEYYRLKKLSRN